LPAKKSYDGIAFTAMKPVHDQHLGNIFTDSTAFSALTLLVGW